MTQEQEKELYNYLLTNTKLPQFWDSDGYQAFLKETSRVILERYDLFPIKDEPRE